MDPTLPYPMFMKISEFVNFIEKMDLVTLFISEFKNWAF